MQVEGTIFLRSFSSSSKHPVKCSRNTPFLTILQKGLEAFRLSTHEIPSNYTLRWQNTILDLCSCIQFSPVPFGSTLDISMKRNDSSSRTNNPMIIKVCLQQMNSGARSVLLFNAQSSPKIWQVLRVVEAVNLAKDPLQLDRKGFIVRLVSNGRLFNERELVEVSLSQLGTNVLLRLSLQPGNQTLSLPSLEGDFRQFLHADEGENALSNEEKETKNSNLSQSTCNLSNEHLPNPQITPSISSQSAPLHFELLDSLPHVENTILPDSHYEFTVAELRELASSNALRQQQAENAPLASHTLASQKREKELRAKYSECKIRVRLPPGLPMAAVDATFGSGEKVEALFAFLQGLNVDLQGWEFLVPNHAGDLLALRGLSFFDAGLYPAALVIAVAKKANVK